MKIYNYFLCNNHLPDIKFENNKLILNLLDGDKMDIIMREKCRDHEYFTTETHMGIGGIVIDFDNNPNKQFQINIFVD